MKEQISKQLQVYAAIITSDKLWIRGRLLKDHPTQIDYSDSVFTVVKKSIASALTKELKQHDLTIAWADHLYEITTDHEGYFEVFESIGDRTISRKAMITYYFDARKKEVEINLREILDQCGEGIISDIDDTILMTKVKSFFRLKMIFNTIFVSPFRRKTIQGASSLYNRMQQKKGVSIIAYISNSPWNMYNYLSTFLSHNDFPEGVLSLRDFGLQMFSKKPSLEKQNKFLEIKRIMELFPNTTFTLIGDTAEYDYDIYRIAQIKYPNQVKKIIIRKTGNRKNEKRILNNLSSNTNHTVVMVKSFDDVIV